ALAEASQDKRVKAVAEYYGGMSDDFQRSVTHMPPTLILHGEKDSMVPVSQAYELHKFLAKLGASSELRIYPGQEHGFDMDGDPASAKDAGERGARVFRSLPGEMIGLFDDLSLGSFSRAAIPRGKLGRSVTTRPARRASCSSASNSSGVT